MDLSDSQKKKLQNAYDDGELKTVSSSPEGDPEWKQVSRVAKADIPWENVYEVVTDKGSFTATGGHRIYQSPVRKVEVDNLSVEDRLFSVSSDGLPYFQQVQSVEEVENRNSYFDIKVEDNHNFRLHDSDVIVSNSPDRNYHFRPPTSTGTVNQFNEAFGYIWEDDELVEYMQRAIDHINLWPPATNLKSVRDVVRRQPSWRQMVLTGAMYQALFALSINWVAEEFSIAGEEKVEVVLPDGEEIEVTMKELFEIWDEVEEESVKEGTSFLLADC